MLSKTTGMNPVVADFFNIGNLAGGFGMRNFGPKLKPVKDMAVSANPTGTQWTAATTRPQLTGLTKGLYVNEAGTNTFMLIGNNMKSVSTDRGNNWTTSTLGEYTLTDLIYVDSNWYAIGSNGTKRLLLQNTASTFDQSNKILDLPDYSRQVIKINT